MNRLITVGFPHPPGHGGPGSFQNRFEQALIQAGYEITYAVERCKPDIIFVVGGTKRIVWLLTMKFSGVPIIHRLDGLSWLHRQQDLKAFLHGEWGNFLFKFIHSFLATHVVYQSEFVKNWWDKSGWRKPSSFSIINNGVDLKYFRPNSGLSAPIDLLCVEGTLDYSPYAIELLNYLQVKLIAKSDYKSLVLFGGFQDMRNRERLHPDIDYRGKVAREQLPAIYRDAVYLSLDVNAACPNTVVEALACGLPVVGYDTGALKELVGEAGEVVDYGGNPWKRETPDFNALKKGLIMALDNYEKLSEKSKVLSIKKYSFDKVMMSFSDLLNKVLNKRKY